MICVDCDLSMIVWWVYAYDPFIVWCSCNDALEAANDD